MSAGVQLSTPLALGLTLEFVVSTTSGAFACPVTMQSAELVGSPYPADVGVSWPLALGMGLMEGYPVTTSGAFACPITMQAATLTEAATGADIGVTWPLLLGMVLPTEGVATYGITSGAFTCPITMQAADSSSSIDSVDAGVSWPLAIGMLLYTASYTLTSGAFVCPIVIAEATASEYEYNPPLPPSGTTESNSGGWDVQGITRSREESALAEAKTAISAASGIDALSAKFDADVERIRQRRAQRAEERRSQEVTSEIKKLLDERLGIEESIAQEAINEESAALAMLLALA